MSGFNGTMISAGGGNIAAAGIVTGNLHQWVDTSNINSWAGWGNTVYDLTANTLNYYTINFNASYARANTLVDQVNGGTMVFQSNNGIFGSTYDGASYNPIAATGQGNWTLEAWYKLTQQPIASTSTKPSIVGEVYGGFLNQDVHHMLGYESNAGVTTNQVTGGSYSAAYYLTSPPANTYPGQYYHAAVSCSNGNVRLFYINGVQVANITSAVITGASDLDTRIGSSLSANSVASCSVAVVRYYDKTLTPTELIKNYNSERGRFVGGSVQLNGTDAFILSPGSASWQLGTNDYTVECWAKATRASSNTLPQPIFAVDNSNSNVSIQAYIENVNSTTGYFTLTAANTVIFQTPIVGTYQNTWTHYAISRVANNTTLFVNGQNTASNSDNSNVNNSTSVLRIGVATLLASQTHSGAGGFQYFDGHMTNFNWVKGTGLYSNNFIPSRYPTNADANTKLLVKTTDSYSYLRDSSPQQSIVTNSGTATFSTSSPYGPTKRQAIFNYTGSAQTWTVPAGVTSIQAAATGARGGTAPNALSSYGGYGGSLGVTLAVTPGQQLTIVVGGWPNISGPPAYGFAGSGGTGNGTGFVGNGSAGGGLSGIFNGTATFANVLVVAGGGGGSTGTDTNYQGGNGGIVSPGSGANGEGGTGTGYGRGATRSAGGATAPPATGTVIVSTAGSGLQGGNGGSGTNSYYGGGGGGGGYYGGGGGTGGYTNTSGGGGGGSSYSIAVPTWLPPFDLLGNGVVLINYVG